MREKSILGILTLLFHCSVNNTVIRCHEFIIIMSNYINNCLQLSLETNYLLSENFYTSTSSNSSVFAELTKGGIALAQTYKAMSDPPMVRASRAV